MTGELNEISRAIGGLEAKASTEAERAREHRETTRQQLEAINAKLAPLAALAADVAEMKPAVDDWRMTKQKALGIVIALSLVAGALGFLVNHAGTWISKKLGWS